MVVLYERRWLSTSDGAVSSNETRGSWSSGSEFEDLAVRGGGVVGKFSGKG